MGLDRKKDKNEEIAIRILDDIDRARSGTLTLEELEYRIWRLLDEADNFPQIIAGRLENMVLELQRLQNENIAASNNSEADENRGADVIYNEVTGAIARYLG